jgi:hypothetical protein
MKTIYFIRQEKTNAILIGQSEGYPYAQLSLAESMSPYGCELLGTITEGNTLDSIIQMFEYHQLTSMWFDVEKIHITRLNGFTPAKLNLTVSSFKRLPKGSINQIVKEKYQLDPQFNRVYLAAELGVSRQTIHNCLKSIIS